MATPPNPKPKLEFTEEQIETVKRMTAEKRPQREIAEAIGISLTSLRRHFRDMIGVTRRGPPPPLWTEAHRNLVTALTGFGCCPEEIARLFHTTAERIRKDFEYEIDTANVRVNAKVASALYQAAINGNVTAQIAWLRARGGWKDSIPKASEIDPIEQPDPKTQSPQATRANVRDAARRLSKRGREAMREVVDDLAANSARLVNG